MPSKPTMGPTLFMVTVADRALLAGPSDRLLVWATGPEKARQAAAQELGCTLDEVLDAQGAALAGIPNDRLRPVS